MVKELSYWDPREKSSKIKSNVGAGWVNHLKNKNTEQEYVIELGIG